MVSSGSSAEGRLGHYYREPPSALPVVWTSGSSIEELFKVCILIFVWF